MKVHVGTSITIAGCQYIKVRNNTDNIIQITSTATVYVQLCKVSHVLSVTVSVYTHTAIQYNIPIETDCEVQG